MPQFAEIYIKRHKIVCNIQKKDRYLGNGFFMLELVYQFVL